jgi:hypothetical protein
MAAITATGATAGGCSNGFFVGSPSVRLMNLLSVYTHTFSSLGHTSSEQTDLRGDVDVDEGVEDRVPDV